MTQPYYKTINSMIQKLNAAKKTTDRLYRKLVNTQTNQNHRRFLTAYRIEKRHRDNIKRLSPLITNHYINLALFELGLPVNQPRTPPRHR